MKYKAYFFSFLFLCALATLKTQANIQVDLPQSLKYSVKVHDVYAFLPDSSQYVHKRSQVRADIYDVSVVHQQLPIKNKQAVELANRLHPRKIQVGESFVLFYPSQSLNKEGGALESDVLDHKEKGKQIIVVEASLLENGELLKVYLPESMKQRVLDSTLKGLFLDEEKSLVLSDKNKTAHIKSSDYSCRMEEELLKCMIDYQVTLSL